MKDLNSNSVLWNAMIYPLLNTTIYGVIWYQGEANALYRSNVYNCTFPAMIDGWRREWFQSTQENTNPEFPFGFVQVCLLYASISHTLFKKAQISVRKITVL